MLGCHMCVDPWLGLRLRCGRIGTGDLVPRYYTRTGFGLQASAGMIAFWARHRRLGQLTCRGPTGNAVACRVLRRYVPVRVTDLRNIASSV